MTITTIAQQISAALGNDGMQWTTRPTDGTDPQTLDDLAWSHRPRLVIDIGRDATRYTFPDGSIISCVGGAWDYGFPGCFCWAGCPHSDCPESHEEAR